MCHISQHSFKQLRHGVSNLRKNEIRSQHHRSCATPFDQKKSNFRQCGQMKKQRWEASEKRREGKGREERRGEEKDERRKTKEERRKKKEERRKKKEERRKKKAESRKQKEERRKKKEEERRKKIREEKETEERRKKMQVCEKKKVSRPQCFSTALWLRGVEKLGLLKRRARNHLGRWEMKNCTQLSWCKADFEVTKLNAPERFWGLWCWKVHAGVARSTCRNAKCKKQTVSGNFWECALLSREAHFQVKMYKTPQCRNTLEVEDVQKVHAVVAWRSRKCLKLTVSDHFWKLGCGFAW